MIPFTECIINFERNAEIFLSEPCALFARIFCIASTAGTSKLIGNNFVPDGNKTISYCCFRAKALKEKLCHACSAKGDAPAETQVYFTPSSPDV